MKNKESWMMQNKLKFFVVIFIAILGINLWDNYYDAYKTEQEITIRIEDSLNANCDCETISKDMYSKGIQYSKGDGFSVEKVSFVLKNCSFNSFEEEKRRIHKMLLEDVDDLKSFNLVSLDIISANRHDTVTIRNGELEL